MLFARIDAFLNDYLVRSAPYAVLKTILISSRRRAPTAARCEGTASSLLTAWPQAAAILFLIGLAPGASAQTGTSIEQLNNDNSAVVVSEGAGNEAAIFQDGERLIADLEIHGEFNTASVLGDNVIFQQGEDSYTEVQIAGDNNAFTITQIGPQGESAGNVAAIAVNGDNNEAVITQSNTVSGDYVNEAAIYQTGAFNTGVITQEIDPRDVLTGQNTAEISQTGEENYAEISQLGANNNALIEQTGNRNTGAIVQDGEGLSAVLRQEGVGLDYTITQTGCVVGGCAPVVVTQTGP